MKSPEQRIDELEATVARLSREVARLNQREAHPARRKDGTWICKPDADIAKGDTGTVNIYAGDEDLELQVEDVSALGADVSEDKWCVLWYDPTGKPYVWPWECD